MTRHPFILEGEKITREGETHIEAVVWEDFDSVSTAGTEAYINGSSDTANLLSGTTSAAGNTLTLPTLTIPAGAGGVSIIVEPAVVANSQTKKTGIVYRVLKPGSAR